MYIFSQYRDMSMISKNIDFDIALNIAVLFNKQQYLVETKHIYCL